MLVSLTSQNIVALPSFRQPRCRLASSSSSSSVRSVVLCYVCHTHDRQHCNDCCYQRHTTNAATCCADCSSGKDYCCYIERYTSFVLSAAFHILLRPFHLVICTCKPCRKIIAQPGVLYSVGVWAPSDLTL